MFDVEKNIKEQITLISEAEPPLSCYHQHVVGIWDPHMADPRISGPVPSTLSNPQNDRLYTLIATKKQQLSIC